MRVVQQFLILIVLGMVGLNGLPLRAENFLDAAPAPDITTQSTATPTNAAASQDDNANLEGCQVIARVDDQIVLACEVLWNVNQMLEAYQKNADPNHQVPDEKLKEVRQQLMQKDVAAMVDRKLLYGQFLHNVPKENLPKIEENLRQPFEEHEMPAMMKRLNVDNQADLEKELARLGSSLADVRRSFNERIIASEWIRSKVKVNDEVSPDEMIEYYRSHLVDYDYPSQARWEELMVRKNRFKDEGAAYEDLAHMGNEVWHSGTQKPVHGAAFVDIAKAKSDGFTAKEGGLHEWTTRGALQSKAIDDALFTLQVGQMSQILDSGPAFHIVRVLERKEAGRKPFTEVQSDIRDRLKDIRYQKEAVKYLTKLRREARIWTIFTGNVSAETLIGKKADETQKR